MKIKLLTFILSVCFLAGCQESDPVLEVSATTFETDGQAGTFTVNVTSDSDWSVESSTNWCTPNTLKGSKDYALKLDVKANTDASSRTATVVVKAGKTSQSITVIQGPKIETSTYHYKLPVIFHVIYQNKSDAKQYVPATRISSVLAETSKFYKANVSSGSVDMNLEFALATEDPNGNTLAEAGVDYIQASNVTIDCEVFMSSENGKPNNINSPFMKNYWDPNKYINVFVYTFTEKAIMGVSHLPFTPTTNSLEGLGASDWFFTRTPEYPHCVSINNSYFGSEYDTGGGNYSSRDVRVTLAHELGHYLGLHHAFSEGEDGETDFCGDTDFCEDTPTYNSDEYYIWLPEYIKKEQDAGRGLYLNNLATKQDCSGKSFLARNVMDYVYCLSDVLTNDQRTRIRHVLANSPIIPGPKNTRAMSRGPVETTPPPVIFKK